MDTIEVREALEMDLESLTTILPRSFHPVNDYVKKALPDTPAMREWWRAVYHEEIADPACHPIVAVDTVTQEVIGTSTLRLIGPQDPHGGFWTKHAWTTDHNTELWGPPIGCMQDAEKRLMAGRPYYLLEFMAVDHAYARTGIGKRIVARSCEVADEWKTPIFLQSGNAKGFYLKLGLGFVLMEEPVWEGYQGAILVRPASEKSSVEGQ